MSSPRSSSPRLVAMAGPLEGRVLEIDELPFSIGRHSDNRLQIRQVSVSRHQCVIEERDGSLALRDLDSRHGTFVNNLPVTRRRLEHGDYVRFSDSVFLFLVQPDPDRESSPPIALEDGDFVARSTVRMPVGEVLYLETGEMSSGFDTAPPTPRQLDVMLRISTAIHSIRGVAALAQRVMELLLEVVPGDRAAVVTSDPAGELGEGYSYHPKEPGKTVHVSRTLAQRVMDERVAVLSNDVLTAEDFHESESLQAARIQSLTCAPLRLLDRVLGVLYVDTRSPRVRFSEDDLRLVSAVAAILATALDNVRHMEWLVGENRRLQTAELEHGMVGESRSMQEVYELISRVSRTDSTVLVLGESGTGKELAAKAIHGNSPRGDKPFVAINCATLSETLLESELFGHVKGAFTGAERTTKGKFEVADGGTVFLDEVGEIPSSLQAKLLRALEEREIERVGSARRIKIDIRLIAATNRDLEEAIREGTFREDLYYRLNVIELPMPPLRERRDDVPLLARHFAARFGQRFNRPVVGISPRARECLLAYDWPGNVRELANALERAVVLGQSDMIHPEDLPEAVVESRSARGGAPTTYHEVLHETKCRLILEAFTTSGGNYTRTAERLGLHPNYLHRLIRNLGLKDRLRA